MLDFSLPPASGVLPIDAHDLLAHDYPPLQVTTTTQVNSSPDDYPPPPRI